MGAQAAAVPGVNFAATGDGQRLAESIGGVILNGELALGPELRFQAPSSRPLAARLPPWTLIGDFLSWSMGNLPGKMLRPLIMKFLTTTLAPSKSLFAEGALLVDRGGRALDTHGADPAISVSNTAENEAFIIVDIGVWKRFNQWPHYVSTAPGIAYAYMDDYVRNRKDICHRGDTIEALAKSIGANAATLVQTMQSRQEMPCEGPYWALGPVKSVFVHTEGGLSVDCAHRVLRSSKDPIAGLYASGSTGQGGLLLRGHGHHLAWAFVSGRRAGRNASEWAKKYSAVQAVAAALVS
jgi:fumarate reductase flavoprotein subunit